MLLINCHDMSVNLSIMDHKTLNNVLEDFISSFIFFRISIVKGQQNNSSTGL